MLYLYQDTKQPTPGAMSYAFHMRFGLPVFGLVIGVPTLKPSYFKAHQPPQSYYYHQIPIAGYGGVQHGNVNSQGLSRSQLGLDYPSFG